MLRWLWGCLIVIAFISCKKERHIVTISGMLLQSSSNPVPVGNYTLSFYQQGSTPELIDIGTYSASATCVTTAAGNFQCNFTEGKGTFLGISMTNKGNITMSGQRINNMIPFWTDLPASDTTLQNIFLYKIMHSAIVKIIAATDISASDTFIVQAPTLSGLHNKLITGVAIAANSTIAIDTIQDMIFTTYSFASKQYENPLYLYKNRASYGYYAPEPGLDENEKAYIFSIP